MSSKNSNKDLDEAFWNPTCPLCNETHERRKSVV